MKTLSALWSVVALALMAATAVNADRKQILDLLNARKGNKAATNSGNTAVKTDRKQILDVINARKGNSSGKSSKKSKGTPASSPSSSSGKSSKAPKAAKKPTGPKGSPQSPTLPDGPITPVPAAPPVTTPVAMPDTIITPVPAAPPVAMPDTTNPDCQPTVGPCISNGDDLISVLATVPDESIVAICGGGQTVLTSDAPVIDGNQITLCCIVDNCVIAGDGTNSNLVVNGDSVTIQDMVFMDGKTSDTDGGNVGIFGNGNHRIINSSFRNGAATTAGGGGNLYVKTEGTVTIENSEFVNGMSTEHGGGVAIGGATAVTIIESLFMGNMAAMGGGLHVTQGNPVASGMMITIEGSRFFGNSGAVGGGFMVSLLGIMPSLAIMNTEFSDNSSDFNGAVGAIADFLDNLELDLSGNYGDGNIADAPQFCNDFAAVDNPNVDEPTCIDVDEDFP